MFWYEKIGDWPTFSKRLKRLLRDAMRLRGRRDSLPSSEYTVFYHYNKWKKKGVWNQILVTHHQKIRVADGREPTPSAGSVDSQTIKTTEMEGEHGYDGGKKINGRKRHIFADVMAG